MHRSRTLLARVSGGGRRSGSAFSSSSRNGLFGALLGLATLTTVASASSPSDANASSSSSWFSFGGGQPAVGAAVSAASTDAVAAAAAAAPITAESVAAPAAATHASRASGPNVVFAWGSNQFGQLGTETSAESEAVPRHLTDLDELDLVDISAAAESVLALAADGTLYAWGRGDNYVLGQGRRWELSRSPLPVAGLPPVVSAALSASHAAAIDAEGRVWTWGNRALGRPFTEATAGVPGPVAGGELGAQRAVKVACGLNHTLIVTENGQVFALGSNAEGAMGLGEQGNMSLTDKATWATHGNAAAASVNSISSSSSSANCTASGLNGKLNGTFELPVRVRGLDGLRVTDVAAGKRFSLFLTADGRVFSCGDDSYGQTGQGAATAGRCVYTPRPVAGLHGHRVVAVSAGEQHAAAVTEDGAVFTWGLGSDGQMGTATRAVKNANAAVISSLRDAKGVRAADVACGGGHTIVRALPPSAATPAAAAAMAAANASERERARAAGAGLGQLWVWGRGRDGQLGRGDRMESVAAGRDRPMQLDFVKGRYMSPAGEIVKVQAGTNSSYALAKK